MTLARRTVSFAAATALAVGPLGIAAAHADAPDPSSRAEIVALLSDSIRSLSLQSSVSDPRYFSGGAWTRQFCRLRLRRFQEKTEPGRCRTDL